MSNVDAPSSAISQSAPQDTKGPGTGRKPIVAGQRLSPATEFKLDVPHMGARPRTWSALRKQIQAVGPEIVEGLVKIFRQETEWLQDDKGSFHQYGPSPSDRIK